MLTVEWFVALVLGGLFGLPAVSAVVEGLRGRWR